MPSFSFYQNFKLGQLDGQRVVNFVDDMIKVALLDNTHTVDLNNHTFLSDVNGDEVSGPGYVAGGIVLGAKTLAKDNPNARVIFDAEDALFSQLTLAARWGVVYKDTGGPATSPLIALVDFDADQVLTDFDLVIEWDGLVAGTGMYYQL